MFWFIVAIVVFILWRADRSQLKKQAKRDYDGGWWGGYVAMKDKVAELVRHEGIQNKALDKFLKAAGAQVPKDTLQYEEDEPAEKLVTYAQNANSETVEAEFDEIDNELEAASNYSQAELPTQPQPTLSPEEIEAEKERRTLQNLNTLLYVGSFLIVAAMATFVTLTMPAGVKLASLILVTLGFYVTGMVLHAKSQRLHIAAVAFVGTGLAILPFIGFALNSLGGLSPSVAWLITSAVGIVAYAFAAIRLQSQLVSYVTIAFVLSLALSTVSSLRLGILWYFIATIGISTLFNSIHFLRPQLLPKIFWQPVEQAGLLTTPIALGASLFVMDRMETFMYEVLFAVATAHYMVVWLETRTRVYEIVVRGLAHVTLLIAAYDAIGGLGSSQDITSFNIVWILLAGLQVVYSLVRIRKAQDNSIETIAISLAVGLLIFSMPLWWLTDYPSRGLAFSLMMVGLVTLGATLRLRQIVWAYCGLAVSVLLPFVLARGAIEPPLGYEILVYGFATLACMALTTLGTLQSRKYSQTLVMFAATTAISYGLTTLIAGVLSGQNILIACSSVIAAAVLIVLSYLMRTALAEIIGAILVVFSVGFWLDWLEVNSDWRLLVGVVVSSAILGAAAYAHHKFGERYRRDGIAILEAIVVAALVLNIGNAVVEVSRVSLVLLLCAGVAALAARFVVPDKKSALSNIGVIGELAYPVLALMLSWQLGGGWPVLVLAVITATLWISSFVEKTPAFIAIGNVTLLLALSTLWSWLNFDSDWQYFGVVWIATAVYYLQYWYFVDKGDRVRQHIALVSTFVVLGLVSLAYLFSGDSQWVMASAGSLLVGAAIGALYGYMNKNKNYIETAIYVATLALQFMTKELLPEVNIVLYAHWWAATIAFIAFWRGGMVQQRLVIAMAFVTGSSGLYALDGADGYSIFFLVEHLSLLAAGGLLRVQWALWWGIVASVVAVLYFLRNYTSAMLLFLGFVIILIVIWRLLKVNKK